jgi:hypothetical protein
LGPVIELCRTCGFHIPADEPRCPGCAPAPHRIPLAARQVAGLALPTRSVRPLPTTPPAREARDPHIGRARTARSAFSFATAFVLLTFAAAGLAWLASQPRFVLEVPDGTHALLDGLTTALATASVLVLAVGLVALVLWCIRRAAMGIVAYVDRRRYA